jgi:hypothetical protein
VGFKAETLVGRWSSSWGASDLLVSGAEVSGTWDEGDFKGTASEDGVLSLVWKHRDGTSGKATLRASEGALDGTWGFGDDDKGGGAWVMRLEAAAPSPAVATEPAPAPAGEPGPAPEPAPEPAPKPKKK